MMVMSRAWIFCLLCEREKPHICFIVRGLCIKQDEDFYLWPATDEPSSKTSQRNTAR